MSQFATTSEFLGPALEYGRVVSCTCTLHRTMNSTLHISTHLTAPQTSCAKASRARRNDQWELDFGRIVGSARGAAALVLCASTLGFGSGEDVLDHDARDIRKTEVAAIEAV